jgi:hypothetical protein
MGDAEYSFDFAAEGDDLDDIVENGGSECLVRLDRDDWLLSAVGDLPTQPVEGTQNNSGITDVGVPMWAMTVCFETVLGLASDYSPTTFAADTMIHAQTLAYAKDAAHNADFHLTEEGEPRSWPTMGAFAASIGKWATERRQSSDPSPALAYAEDFVPLDNASAFPEPQYAYLNRLLVSDLVHEGNYAPWMRLQYLLYPVTPRLELDSEDDAENAIVARLILSAASEVDPAQAQASQKLAVMTFLAGKVPYQLVKHGVSLPQRVAYVKLLKDWATPSKRIEIVEQQFSMLLTHESNLNGWVGGTPEPYRAATLLFRAIFAGSAAFDLEGAERLNDALPSYDDYYRSKIDESMSRVASISGGAEASPRTRIVE